MVGDHPVGLAKKEETLRRVPGRLELLLGIDVPALGRSAAEEGPVVEDGAGVLVEMAE